MPHVLWQLSRGKEAKLQEHTVKIFPMMSTFPQGYGKYSFNSIVFKVSGPLVPIPGIHTPSETLGKFTCLFVKCCNMSAWFKFT